ncbi:MAG: hypothetical protein EA369_08300 [Bradymonadales bacterium]|nr:MAG: hypothetical protein EA369_08300 [Bradymonadales bacterium]
MWISTKIKGVMNMNQRLKLVAGSLLALFLGAEVVEAQGVAAPTARMQAPTAARSSQGVQVNTQRAATQAANLMTQNVGTIARNGGVQLSAGQVTVLTGAAAGLRLDRFNRVIAAQGASLTIASAVEAYANLLFASYREDLEIVEVSMKMVRDIFTLALNEATAEGNYDQAFRATMASFLTECGLGAKALNFTPDLSGLSPQVRSGLLAQRLAAENAAKLLDQYFRQLGIPVGQYEFVTPDGQVLYIDSHESAVAAIAAGQLNSPNAEAFLIGLVLLFESKVHIVRNLVQSGRASLVSVGHYSEIYGDIMAAFARVLTGDLSFEGLNLERHFDITEANSLVAQIEQACRDAMGARRF